MTACFDIVNADCTEWLPGAVRSGFRASAVVTDPPYHLASIQKRFGSANAAPAVHGRDGAAGRLSRGFMGSPTDAGDIAFRPETWKAVAAAMEPGARLCAFGGARTWWRLAAAIDAAGFEIEDTILWVYSQGLVLRQSRLKPCVEPIILARMPGPLRNLNIDACRVPRGEGVRGGWPGNLILDGSEEVVGCLPDAPGQLADARSDGAPKNNKVYGAMRHRQGEASAERRYANKGSTNFAAKPGQRRFDTGSAARFFTQCAFTEAERSMVYCPKATKAERMCFCEECSTHFRATEGREHAHGRDNMEHVKAHPTTKPISLLRHLARLITPRGGMVLDPFAGSCTLAEAAYLEGFDSVCIEKETMHAESGRERMQTIAR